MSGKTLPAAPAGEALAALEARGFDFYSGVACSILAPLITELTRVPGRYRPAPREDLAVGLAAGAYLAGRRPVALMQNSGLGYSLNALMSLNWIYRIPLLLVIGYRGFGGAPARPDGACASGGPADAPEHWVIGAHGEALLKEIGIPVWVPDAAGWAGAVDEAAAWLERERRPAALMLRKGIVS